MSSYIFPASVFPYNFPPALLHNYFSFFTQMEPRLSAQMKAVSAEYLGPILDPTSSTKQQYITKSLASLTDIQEDGLSLVPGTLGLSLSLREPYHRDRASRTISLPVRGHTLWVIKTSINMKKKKALGMNEKRHGSDTLEFSLPEGEKGNCSCDDLFVCPSKEDISVSVPHMLNVPFHNRFWTAIFILVQQLCNQTESLK